MKSSRLFYFTVASVFIAGAAKHTHASPFRNGLRRH